MIYKKFVVCVAALAVAWVSYGEVSFAEEKKKPQEESTEKSETKPKEEKSKRSIPVKLWGQGSFHIEKRGNAEVENGDFYVGIDFQPKREWPLWLGLKFGFINENLLTNSASSNFKYTYGVQVYGQPQFGNVFGFKLGASADLVNGDVDDPLYFLPNFFAGPTFNITPKVAFEALVQFAWGPAFSTIPEIYRFGGGLSLLF